MVDRFRDSKKNSHLNPKGNLKNNREDTLEDSEIPDVILLHKKAFTPYSRAVNLIVDMEEKFEFHLTPENHTPKPRLK